MSSSQHRIWLVLAVAAISIANTQLVPVRLGRAAIDLALVVALMVAVSLGAAYEIHTPTPAREQGGGTP